MGNKIKNFFKKAEIRLVAFLFYIAALIYFLVSGHGWWSVFYTHLFFVLLYGLIYSGGIFLMFLISPIMAVILPLQNYSIKRYLRKFKQNISAEVVVVLGRSDWFRLEAWLRHNFLKSEIKALVKYLEAKKQDFSFYPNAAFDDVEKIMRDKNIKEVYFFGHGTSHVFQLNTREYLYYCDFNDFEKYGKEFVHQVHCGTPDGKSLVDYVVSKENRSECFLFRKPINSFDIRKELKRRRKLLNENKI